MESRTTVEVFALKNSRENNFPMLKSQVEMERKLLPQDSERRIAGAACFPSPHCPALNAYAKLGDRAVLYSHRQSAKEFKNVDCGINGLLNQFQEAPPPGS